MNEYAKIPYVGPEAGWEPHTTLSYTKDVIRMFKYLLLKSYFKLSDRGLVERTQTDLLFKYFSEVSLVISSRRLLFSRPPSSFEK